MAQIINTNIASLNAQNNLSKSNMALQTSLQRLSSGLRINSAKDDAAGLAISDRMTSQINGMNQALRNANDGISLAQTAEGAMSVISDNLQRMRTLAVQAANGTNTSSDRAAIQSELSQLQAEINRITDTTQFNGQNVIDGTLSNAQFQVGANANQTINAAISSTRATAIGNNQLQVGNSATAVASVYSTSATALTQGSALFNGTTTAWTNNNTAAQALTLVGNGQTVSVPNTTLVIGASAKLIADSVNNASGTTGVSATASTTAVLSTFTAGSVTLKLQGAPSSTGASAPVTISATLATATDMSGLAAAINAQTGVTGITAVADNVSGKVTLTQSQGYDIGVQNQTTSAGAVTLTGTLPNGAAATARVLTSAVATSTSVVGGLVSFSSSSAFTLSTTGANFLAAANTTYGSSLSSVAAIDVTTVSGGVPTGANSAISIIDAAVSSINSARASLGAMQNRFSSVLSNLQSSAENLTASRSRIQDTDFASETAQLTRGQILQQAGTAMLAQANALPNGVLALLR